VRSGVPVALGVVLSFLSYACSAERSAARVDEASPLTSQADSREALAALPTVGRSHGESHYRREFFGHSWHDVDGNGCNQRDDVLLRDALPGTVRSVRQGGCSHDVLAGTWVDPYTGVSLVFANLKEPAQAQAIQIDHVVPLAEAWVSGASAWDDERRERFANDLDSLLAVDGPTNASKGSHDPAAWRPKQDFQCDYAVRWIAVKAEWRLGVDPSERRALSEMLEACGSSTPSG